MLLSMGDGNDDVCDEEEDEVDDIYASDSQSSLGVSYPPTGRVLVEMVKYHLEQKKIPFSLPASLTAEKNPFPSTLAPVEEECYQCSGHLRPPQEITSRTMIIGITKVISG